MRQELKDIEKHMSDAVAALKVKWPMGTRVFDYFLRLTSNLR